MTLTPKIWPGLTPGGTTARPTTLCTTTPCAICGAKADAPHLNCANVDCNKLFLACDKCKLEYQGCCCEVCTAAPRMLRPIKKDGYYAKLHTYVKAKEKAHEV